MNKWQNKFMKLAKEVSNWSKDPSRKIGAVLVDKNRRIIGCGYNGFPKGIKDTLPRLNNKRFKRLISVHAEENAILNSTSSLEGSSIFIYGLCCCTHCAALLIQSGIKHIYYTISQNRESTHWKRNLLIAKSMLKEAGVKVTEVKIHE